MLNMQNLFCPYQKYYKINCCLNNIMIYLICSKSENIVIYKIKITEKASFRCRFDQIKK